jgi:threonine synthase
MRYISTRGGMEPQGFTDILLGGLAPDGGLSLPEHYPKVDAATLQEWRGLSYPELAFRVLSLYCTDIPADDLRRLCHATYTAQVFGSDAITPVVDLETGIKLQKLSEGPTLAFKDCAMQMLGSLFEYALAKSGNHLNILGATSGDTGSAAEYAMRGRKGIRVFMLSPHQRMSAFQTAQMFSLKDANIFNIALNGVFDDCQDLVKAVSNDAAFKARYAIGTVNSINWARVLAQAVYYFRGYFAATTSNDQQVSFTVPSGNFGNVFAGHIARQMGLPIAQLVVATNENDVLDEFFKTGRYKVRASRDTFLTSSPSMDISKASNFERFVCDLMGRDTARTKALYQEVDTQGAFNIGGSAEFAKVSAFGFVSGKSTHAKRLETIRSVHKTSGVVIDTHTADGLYVARQHLQANIPMICLETALPAKFAETIVEALGTEPQVPAQFADIAQRAQRFTLMPNDLNLLKEFVANRALV